MGQPSPAEPVLRLVAIFTRHDQAFAWARQQLTAAWGPILTESQPFEFHETDYYEATMGPGLRKAIWTFADLADPGDLAAWKHQTNAFEAAYASLGGHVEPRPLNLDAGYLTLGKLVLASTKDHAHRVYLGNRIYAEVTLHFRNGAWQVHPWTYADYRRPDVQDFLLAARQALHERLVAARRGGASA